MHFDFSAYTGVDFFKQCLVVYDSTFSAWDRLILLGYLALTLYYLVRGRGKERVFFVVYPLVLVIVALNPWMAWFLAKHFHLYERYYRCFWLLPVMAVYAYFIANGVRKAQGKWSICVRYVLMVVLLVMGGLQLEEATLQLYTGSNPNDGMVMVDNRYKIQDDVLLAADIIEQDKGDEQRDVRVASNYQVYSEIRMYDASIIAALKAEIAIEVTQEQLDTAVSEESWYDVVNIVFSGYVAEGQENLVVELDDFITALQQEGVEYVILADDNENSDIWMQVGTVIGDTPNYTVLKIEV